MSITPQMSSGTRLNRMGVGEFRNRLIPPPAPCLMVTRVCGGLIVTPAALTAFSWWMDQQSKQGDYVVSD